jgi:hypothetical protein
MTGTRVPRGYFKQGILIKKRKKIIVYYDRTGMHTGIISILVDRSFEGVTRVQGV